VSNSSAISASLSALARTSAKSRYSLPTGYGCYFVSTRARVETGKSWRNETATFWGLFRMALESRNETGNQLRIYVSFHVKRTRRALGMFLFPFLKRNNGVRNALSSFHSISPPNAGKYPHFRPRLHRAVFYFANYAVSKWVS